MSTKVNNGITWRQKYIDLSEAIFRELGFSPPHMLYDEYQPLSMEMNYAGKPFELIHSSTEMPDKVLISCFLGLLPDEGVLLGLQNMLKANLTLARAHGPVYGLNSETQIIKCMYYEGLDDSLASRVLEKMHHVANDSETWRDNFFLKTSQFSGKTHISNQYLLA
jgi:hypothetical protein